jgi:hypothetical protein
MKNNMTETKTLFVSRGHSVVTPDGVGLIGTSHGPGELVTLPADEADRLAVLGFLQDVPPILPVTVPNPAAIGPQGGDVQGPDYNVVVPR